MKKAALTLIIAGVVLLAAGLVYDAVYAGIPLQDAEQAPAKVVIHYEEQARIARNIFLAGKAAISVGICFWFMYFVQSLARKNK